MPGSARAWQGSDDAKGICEHAYKGERRTTRNAHKKTAEAAESADRVSAQ